MIDNRIRFKLVKSATPDEGEGWVLQSNQPVIFISHEVPDEWIDPKPYEDEHYKGLVFTRKPEKGHKSVSVQSDMF